MKRRYLKSLPWLLSASVAMQMGGVMACAAEIPLGIEMGVFMNSYSGKEDGGDEGSGGNGNGKDDGGGGNDNGSEEGGGDGNGREDGGDEDDGYGGGIRRGSGGNNPGEGAGNSPEGEGAATGGNNVAQPPAEGNVLTEGETVLPTKTKWVLSPSFNAVRAASSDPGVVKAALKKDKSRSTKGAEWNYGLIRVRKPGVAAVTVEGAEGQKTVYTIHAENPEINRAALRTGGYAVIPMNSYVIGSTYLKPISVESGRTAVATVSGDYSLIVSGNGTSRITVRYPKRRIKGRLKSAMPVFAKRALTLKERAVKLRIRNLPPGAAPIYESSNPGIVRVDSSGIVSPVAKGSAAVTAILGRIRISCTVTVR